MKSLLKDTLPFLFFCAMMVSLNAQSNSSANTVQSNKDISCALGSSKPSQATSGCLPSSCRGAQTKFGEAKVITNLRSSLIALKADMEKSNAFKFDTRAYDIHGIVGETDDESLDIIVREIKIIEREFSGKTDFRSVALSLPKSKAQQITYLENRLDTLKKFL